MQSHRSLTWQNGLNPQLVRRLIRPLVQPGIINSQMAEQMIGRSQHFLDRLPLLTRQQQHWSNLKELAAETIPIVYAYPISISTAVRGDQNTALPKTQASENKKHPIAAPFTPTGDMPIQAKFDSSPPLIRPETGQNSENSEKILLVNSQPVGTELISNPEMPVPSKFDSSPPLIRPETSQSSGNSREIPSVNSQPVRTELIPNSEMPIQAKFVSPNREKSENLKSLKIKELKKHSGIDAGGLLDNAEALSPNNPILPQPISSEMNQSSDNPLPIVQVKLTNPNLPLNFPERQRDSYLRTLSLNAKDRQERVNETAKTLQEKHPTPKSHQLPLVQVPTSENVLSMPSTEPLIFSRPPITSLASQATPNNLLSPSHQKGVAYSNPTLSPSETISATHFSPGSGIQVNSTASVTANPQPPIDVDALANKVERKLIRRLVIESERRGQKRWY